MFLAAGLDVSRNPCPLVILEKTGAILECRYEDRDPHHIASHPASLASLQEKVIFCAITDLDARQYPEFVESLKKSKVMVKAYDLYYLLRTENLMRDLRPDLTLAAHCLAKILQSEVMDLAALREHIQELYA